MVVVGGAVVVGGWVSGGAVSGGAVVSTVERVAADAVSVDCASVVVVGGGVTTGAKADAASRPATRPRPGAASAAALVVVEDVAGWGRVENTAKPAIVSNETPSHAAKATRRVLRISPPPPHVSRSSEPRRTGDTTGMQTTAPEKFLQDLPDRQRRAVFQAASTIRAVTLAATSGQASSLGSVRSKWLQSYSAVSTGSPAAAATAT